MSAILVTGGAGAIGSNLLIALDKLGHDVVVLDDLTSGHRHLVPNNVKFVEGSVSDEKTLRAVFATSIDYVVHMAALFANQNSVDHPQLDLTVNGMGTLNVLKMAQEHGVKKVVNVSSSCVYGNSEIMTETDIDFDPDTPYAITKLLGERYCHFWARQFKLDVISLRFFNSYGPHEYPGQYRNVIPNFFEKAMAGEPLTITGTGQETRDFTFVEDTVQGIVGALFGETRPGDVFNIASGRETSILELAEKINRITDNKAEIQFVPRRSWDHVSRRRGMIEKAQNTFGYCPLTELEEGLEKTYKWLKSIHE